MYQNYYDGCLSRHIYAWSALNTINTFGVSEFNAKNLIESDLMVLLMGQENNEQQKRSVNSKGCIIDSVQGVKVGYVCMCQDGGEWQSSRNYDVNSGLWKG